MTSKLLVPQAVSPEPSRGSHQYRATHRDWEEGPELSSRWLSLGYRKDPRLALHVWHEDYCRRLRLRRHLSCHPPGGQLDLLHHVRNTGARQRVMGACSPGLLPELSLCADLVWSIEPPLSSEAPSSTSRPVLSGPRSSAAKSCSCGLVNSSSSIVGRSSSSSFSS